MKIIGLTAFILISLSSVFAQEAKKVDEFEGSYCERYLLGMDIVRSELVNNPTSRIYFLIYEGREFIYNSKENRLVLVFSARNSAKAKIISMKKYLGNGEKTVYIEAGFRENSIVEVWLVPNGATPPKPTPTLKKMKYRKGKPKGFCLGCC